MMLCLGDPQEMMVLLCGALVAGWPCVCVVREVAVVCVEGMVYVVRVTVCCTVQALLVCS